MVGQQAKDAGPPQPALRHVCVRIHTGNGAHMVQRNDSVRDMEVHLLCRRRQHGPDDPGRGEGRRLRDVLVVRVFLRVRSGDRSGQVPGAEVCEGGVCRRSREERHDADDRGRRARILHLEQRRHPSSAGDRRRLGHSSDSWLGGLSDCGAGHPPLSHCVLHSHPGRQARNPLAQHQHLRHTGRAHHSKRPSGLRQHADPRLLEHRRHVDSHSDSRHRHCRRDARVHQVRADQASEGTHRKGRLFRHPWWLL
mmetsp:Transcript_6940/g.12778  ORF Transcript_6940/g.12778 Transcript_6940/m.12778 type:complete len:252 (+) Transcript_6940:297-1052(+)